VTSSKYCTIAIVLTMLLIGFVPMIENVGALDSQLTVSDHCIAINGDDDLASQATAMHWPGTGSPSDPYVIEELSISCDANITAIDIMNTRSHIRIMDCTITALHQEGIRWESYSCGLKLTNVSNAVFSSLGISGFINGVFIDSCSDVTVDNTTATGAKSDGVKAAYSSSLTFDNDTVINNGASGMDVHTSDHLLVQCSNISFNKNSGLDFWLPITDSLIRWNIASRNGWYESGNALYLSGTGNTIYGNILVAPGGPESTPAGCGYGAINNWNSSSGVGNYYGTNYDRSEEVYTSFLGEPACSTLDEDQDGISDDPFTIKCYASNYEGAPEVDHHPLVLPAAPPRNLTASIEGDQITLSWAEPLYFTDPVGHYVVEREVHAAVTEIDVTDTTFTETVDDTGSWTSFNYTVRWAGRYLTSGPSAQAEGRNPDRPSVKITSELGVHRQVMNDVVTYANKTIDPLGVLVEWVGSDSDSATMNYTVQLDGGEWISVGTRSNHTFAGLLEGDHTITVRATDNGMNQVEDSKTFAVFRRAEISVACSPSTEGSSSLLVTGKAFDPVTGDPLDNTQLGLAYSTERGQSWGFDTLTTDADGRFQTTIGLDIQAIMGIIITATLADQYSEERTFFENVTYAAVDLQDREGLFLTRSTSTISDFLFSSEMLKFNITGEEGTEGSTSILIPKAAMSGVDGVKITLDGAEIEYSVASEDDYWVLTFNYTHSSHEVYVDLGSSGSGSTMVLLVIVIVIVAVAAAVGLLVWRRRRKA
jgi:hypothetical protein